MTARLPSTDADDSIRDDKAMSAFDLLPAQRLDHRGLPPPQPLLGTLEAVEAIAAGEVLEIVVDREPLILYGELRARGYPFRAQAWGNGEFRVLIQRSP